MTKENPVHPALARRGVGVSADGLFEMPTRAIFGQGIASRVGAVAQELGGSRAMLAANTSRPSNPREADQAAFRAMLESAL